MGGLPSVPKTNREAICIAKLQGESEGRTLGRFTERSLIVAWLRYQKGTPVELADRILMGDHTRPDHNP